MAVIVICLAPVMDPIAADITVTALFIESFNILLDSPQALRQ